MTPRSFDPATSREMLGDELARTIETKARADADMGKAGYAPPPPTEGTYWASCQGEFARAVYHDQFRKRLDRNERKKIVGRLT